LKAIGSRRAARRASGAIARGVLPLIAWAILFHLMPPDSRAQDVEARLYANVPKGINFIAGVYKYSRGEIVINSAIIEDLRGDIHTVGLGYLRTFSLGGMTAKFDLLVPHLWMKASAKVTGIDSSRTWNGLGDPRFRLTLNFIGAPALAPAEFVKWKQKTIVGASLQVTPPLGKYDSTRLMNLGSNRWTIRAEIAVSRAWRRWVFEGYASVFYFTDNNDFYGGSVLTQEDVGILQAHVIYYFQPRMWLGVDALYAAGGETAVDGTFKNDFQANTRLGASFSLPLARRHNLKLVWSSGVSTRVGGDFDNFALSYFYNW
jgi:hypothetical protein